MDNIEINIPYASFKKDFTIIYKGRSIIEGQFLETIDEIKTSKDEFLHKLRYFKRRTSEINQLNEIFIHDSYCNNIFKEFIKSLETHKIEVNEQNINDLTSLSRKYEYEELETELSIFSKNRPDIQTILDDTKTKDIDPTKEKKLSKNLDICLINQNFINLPLPVLTRILNSPNRVLKDHHLLVEFIKKIIRKYKINNNKELQEEERSNLQILISCLDYTEMTNEEINEFLENDEITSIFNIRHSKEKMKKMINEILENEKRQLKAESRISTLEKQLFEYQQILKEKEKQTQTIIDEMKKSFENELIEFQRKTENKEKDMKFKYSEMKCELDRQQEMICKHNKSYEELQKIQHKFESLCYDHEELKNKFDQQEKILSKYENENNELKHLIKEQETKFKLIEKTSQFKCQIMAKVNEDQKIEGTIKIVEGLCSLDKKQSKFILNMNSNRIIGENEYKEGTEITNLEQEFSFIKSSGTYFLHALIVGSNGNKDEFISEPLSTKGVKYRFNYTGRVQSVKLSPGTYKLEVWGSSGSENYKQIHHNTYSGNAGKGGYSVGTLKLSKETILYVYVGGCSNTSNGGWNGGGSASSVAAGGGGSTDISLYGNEGSTEWNTENHMYSRIIVAGGGGGSSFAERPNYCGGSGGGIKGEDTKNSEVKGGTQNNGYKFGIGETNINSNCSGGGGGWYGGYTYFSGWYRGGGGGSGFVYNSSTAKDYPSGCKLNSSFYLSNSTTICGNTEVPNISGTGVEIGHTGNGYAIITPQ